MDIEINRSLLKILHTKVTTSGLFRINQSLYLFKPTWDPRPWPCHVSRFRSPDSSHHQYTGCILNIQSFIHLFIHSFIHPFILSPDSSHHQYTVYSSFHPLFHSYFQPFINLKKRFKENLNVSATILSSILSKTVWQIIFKILDILKQ